MASAPPQTPPQQNKGSQSKSERKPKRNKMLEGYQFNKFDSDKTPLDYLTPKGEDKRPGSSMTPSGKTVVDLSKGIEDYHVIPPVAIWEKGKWFLHLTEASQKEVGTSLREQVQWYAWVVSGEGTPGNFMIRIYILPDKVAQAEKPRHPIFWPEELKKVVRTSFGFHPQYQQHQQQLAPAKPAPPPAPKLPAGIRFRCTDCGHWFKEDGLAQHKMHVCPGREGDMGDWAIMCECCHDLDMVSTVKPGFPRVLAKKEVKPEEEEKPQEEDKKVASA